MELLWLEDQAAQQIDKVGGKVAHLAELAASYHVPPGFCLTTDAFARWGRTSALRRQDVSPDLHALLAEAYAALAQRTGADCPPIAVRSSAADEDGAGASFAGQYETFLNITGVDAAAHAVLDCWRTARSSRVQSYRRQHGLPPNGVRMAVLLQQMVVADASAFVFSANPITCAAGEIVINATWGLGASIADGIVIPDTFVVRKSDFAILDRRISDKRCMTIMGEGGTRVVSVPRFLAGQPAVTDAQIEELCRLALVLEARMGWPVDVETALSSGQLYLLQCRPVTTLARTPSAPL